MVCSICKLIKRKKKKKIVFNEKKLWKKTTAHSQNILHVNVLYNIKRKKYKTVCAELAIASHLRQHGHDFV
jgi:hypothetical protein